MSDKEENYPGSACYPNIEGRKMSSSLKEKLRRISRGFSSPVLRRSVDETPFTAKRYAIVQNSESSTVMKSFSTEDIEVSANTEQLQEMHSYLEKQLLDNEEKLKKLELVERYSLKNKPPDLLNLIQKWQTASQEALRQLYEKLPENKPQDFCRLLDQLNIDYDTIKYNPMNDTFS